MVNKSREIYLARNRTKRQCKVFTFEAMKNAGQELALKLYGKKSFSLFCHMSAYKELRRHGFIDLKTILNEFKKQPNEKRNENEIKKQKAQRLINYYVSKGKIKRPKKCSICGVVPIGNRSKSGLLGHHPDYNKPSEVIWVCNKCHKDLHSSITNRAVASFQ